MLRTVIWHLFLEIGAKEKNFLKLIYLLELISLISLLAFESLAFKSGTLGVLTGSMGELVRDRLPKNLEGFSGPFGVASNLALPLATAPREKIQKS